MNKVYCDRCKKDMGYLKGYELVNLQINDLKEYTTNNEKNINYRKTLCPECKKVVERHSSNPFIGFLNLYCDSCEKADKKVRMWRYF